MAALSPEKLQQVADVFTRTGSIKETMQTCNVSQQTVRKVRDSVAEQTKANGVLKLIPMPIPYSPDFIQEEAPCGPDLPLPELMNFDPFILDNDGVTAALFDVHVPYHDMDTIRGWWKDAKRSNASVIFLGGDIQDCHTISKYPREVTAPRLSEELNKGRQFFEYLRGTFPKARIIYKEGNHEERLANYLASKAPELADLPDMKLTSLLRLDKYGVEWVSEKRPVYHGKLTILHGHEYAGGGGDRPGQWIYNKAHESVLCGHFHKQDEYTFKTVRQNDHSGFAAGCACYVHPHYRRLNQWSSGWAMIEPRGGGNYKVRLERLLGNGDVV